MKKLFLGVAVVGLFLFSHVAEGADWEYLGFSGHCAQYYDASSIRDLPGGVKKVWMKTEVGDDKCVKHEIEFSKQIKIYTKDFENFKQRLVLVEMKCSTRQYNNLTLAIYNSKDDKVYSMNFPVDWVDIVPESLMDGLYAKICATVPGK